MKHYVLLSFLIPWVSFGATIKCFSGKDVIFNSDVKDIVYNEKFIGFTDKKTKKHYLVSAECIITKS